MAIVVRYEVNGMSSEQYDAIMRDLDAAGLGHPAGRAYHVCFGDKTKLQVVDVFESPAKLEAFGAKLMPILQKHGVNARPDVLGEAHNSVVPA
ncbi:MAG: hypothetical protein U0414_25230 [Polyangiaceae bacterium]